MSSNSWNSALSIWPAIDSINTPPLAIVCIQTKAVDLTSIRFINEFLLGTRSLPSNHAIDSLVLQAWMSLRGTKLLVWIRIRDWLPPCKPRFSLFLERDAGSWFTVRYEVVYCMLTKMTEKCDVYILTFFNT
jgi:hypothetical protein